ncbi:uncharacterized protein LOC129586511 [Paramacrobiotus metropolitanus]|uniref:uncharacterized protein LOC129586511 n=1 Tax=Paramacrobiotus metropolitanus TaxID=2943436 RepID=UPI002445AC28|nr:uncharacterized protein LOC129586511 [Paramacrobiotus metropolitanus]
MPARGVIIASFIISAAICTVGGYSYEGRCNKNILTVCADDSSYFLVKCWDDLLPRRFVDDEGRRHFDEEVPSKPLRQRLANNYREDDLFTQKCVEDENGQWIRVPQFNITSYDRQETFYVRQRQLKDLLKDKGYYCCFNTTSRLCHETWFLSVPILIQQSYTAENGGDVQTAFTSVQPRVQKSESPYSSQSLKQNASAENMAGNVEVNFHAKKSPAESLPSQSAITQDHMGAGGTVAVVLGVTAAIGVAAAIIFIVYRKLRPGTRNNRGNYGPPGAQNWAFA